MIKCSHFFGGWVCEKDVRSILLSWSTSTRICMWICMCLKWWFPSWSWFHYSPNYVHRGVCLQLLPLPRQKQSWAQSWPCSLLVCSLSLAMGVSTLVGLSAQARGVSILDLTWRPARRGGSFQFILLCFDWEKESSARALQGKVSVSTAPSVKSHWFLSQLELIFPVSGPLEGPQACYNALSLDHQLRVWVLTKSLFSLFLPDSVWTFFFSSLPTVFVVEEPFCKSSVIISAKVALYAIAVLISSSEELLRVLLLHSYWSHLPGTFVVCLIFQIIFFTLHSVVSL